jgi:hypothetical protein
MGWGSIIGAVAGPLLGKVLGDDDKTTTTKVEMPAWQSAAMQDAISGMQNAPDFYQNPDQQTAAMNPWLMDTLGQAANHASGAGADQVAMMNQMGLNQAGVGDMQALLGQVQANMGAGFASGGGNYLLDQLSGSNLGGGGAGGGGINISTPDLKFEYDQGTYDQVLGNLLGVAQNAFDSYAGNAKQDALFSNGAGLQMGQALVGGANTKAGQQSSLLDAMTNRQIIDFGAQQAQWAAGQANAGAMNAGTANLQSATSLSNAATSAAASMANASTAANASMYNAKLGAAANLMNQGAGMMGDANSTFNGATNSYGMGADSFGNANTQAINNMNTSLGAGNYVQQYDQAALDAYNNALAYNGNADFNQNQAMLATLNGAPTGQSVTNPMNMQQWMSAGMMMGNQIGNILGTPTSTSGVPDIGIGGAA